MTKDCINVLIIRRYSLLEVARLEVEELHRLPLDKRLELFRLNRMKHPGMQLYLVACITHSLIHLYGPGQDPHRSDGKDVC